MSLLRDCHPRAGRRSRRTSPWAKPASQCCLRSRFGCGCEATAASATRSTDPPGTERRRRSSQWVTATAGVIPTRNQAEWWTSPHAWRTRPCEGGRTTWRTDIMYVCSAPPSLRRTSRHAVSRPVAVGRPGPNHHLRECQVVFGAKARRHGVPTASSRRHRAGRNTTVREPSPSLCRPQSRSCQYP